MALSAEKDKPSNMTTFPSGSMKGIRDAAATMVHHHHRVENDPSSSRSHHTIYPTHDFDLPALDAKSIVVRTATMFTHVLSEARPALLALDLSFIIMDDPHAKLLVTALSNSFLLTLQQLTIITSTMGGDAGCPYGPKPSRMRWQSVFMIMRALAGGACQMLRHLGLGGLMNKEESKFFMSNHPSQPYFGSMLSQLINSGYLMALASLDISYNRFARGEGRKVASALAASRCPNIKSLDISGSMRGLGGEEAALLMTAITGCLRRLEVLKTNQNHHVILPLAQALQTGSLPALHELQLDEVDMTPLGGRALAKAISAGHHRLKVLNLHNTATDTITMDPFLVALHGRHCPDLVELNLSSNWLTDRQGVLLSQAISSKALSNVKVLDLSYNSGILDDGAVAASGLGEVGMVAIFDALQSGGCPQLTSLRLANARLSTKATEALARLLMSKACSKLEVLDLEHYGVDHDHHQGNTTLLLPIIEALSSGCCEHLKRLKLEGNRLLPDDAWALADALGKGTFKDLKELTLDLDRPREDYGLVAIMEALKNGACPQLHTFTSHIGRGSTAAHLLSYAIAAGSLPHLQYLTVSIEGSRARTAKTNMASIMKALDSGVCPGLRAIKKVGQVQTTTSTRGGGLWSLLRTMYRL